jgi:hypothetical protein
MARIAAVIVIVPAIPARVSEQHTVVHGPFPLEPKPLRQQRGRWLNGPMQFRSGGAAFPANSR